MSLQALWAARQAEIDDDARDWQQRARAAAQTAITAQLDQLRAAGAGRFSVFSLHRPVITGRCGAAPVLPAVMVMVLDDLTAAGVLSDEGGGYWTIR